MPHCPSVALPNEPSWRTQCNATTALLIALVGVHMIVLATGSGTATADGACVIIQQAERKKNNTGIVLRSTIGSVNRGYNNNIIYYIPLSVSSNDRARVCMLQVNTVCSRVALATAACA